MIHKRRQTQTCNWVAKGLLTVCGFSDFVEFYGSWLNINEFLLSIFFDMEKKSPCFSNLGCVKPTLGTLEEPKSLKF